MARGFEVGNVTLNTLDEVSSVPLTSADLLAAASHKDPSVREVIAARPDVPLGAMIVLGQDKKAPVRAALAANPMMVRSVTVVEVLLQDKDSKVRLALVSNGALPLALLQKIAVTDKGDVRAAAIQMLASRS
jgi:hypothetical protein